MNKNCEALLMDYAAGSLDTAHSILVASYLTLSPTGRRYVEECEVLGAAMMTYMCDCAAVSEGCLESVMARIDAGDCATAECTENSAYTQTCIQNCAPLPLPLSRVLPSSTDKPQKWHRAFGGMEWIDLRFDDSKSRAQIIRCKPGFVLPHHAHRGQEVTLVLDGAFEDVTGRYTRGDLVIMDDETGHEPAADKEAGCIIISVTDNPVRFTGFFTRFLNPFI